MILYKYLTPKKADKWLIGENSILLTPPIYLNDLLEFRVRREPAGSEERRSIFEKFQSESPCEMTFEEYEAAITRKDFMANEAADMQRRYSKTTGVVSLTSDPANELMWAHYGINCGVAVGYQSLYIQEQNGMRFSFLPMGIAIEVEYSNDVAPIRKDFSDAARILTRKRKCWIYESEWRIVEKLAEAKPIDRCGKTFFALPAYGEQIVHVVFGTNAAPEFMERIKSWVRNSHSHIQKIRVNPSTHDLMLTDV